mgnify:CR=1 FL=1
MEDLQSKAADLVKKALTVGVGALFLTEESVRGLVSEFKLPKELLTGILEGANKAKNEFLQNLSSDVLSRIQDRIDPKALIEEILRDNEIDLHVKISLKQAVVPFASPWRASAVAWGAIAFWLMVAVQFTSLVRNSLPKRVWHGIHLTSYVLAILATIHSILSGSDVGTGWGTLLIAGGVTVAVAASLQRAFGVGRLRRAERAASRGGIDLAERARARSGGRTSGSR